MSVFSLFFYFFATILVLSSLGVVVARNPLYNVLSLVVSIFCLSSLVMLLEAFFVGIILLMVYAGAILIFFLFVVMCLNLNAPNLTTAQQSRFRFLGWLAGLLFFCQLLLSSKSFLMAQALEAPSTRGTIENIGRILFTDYLLPFELTSLLLLIAVFGIVSLAQGALKTGIEKPNV
jgi:NADH-quinone oxidoreductase subunit J